LVGSLAGARKRIGTVKKILCIGEVLAEIMADTKGEGFRAPMPLTGPYPSGAPAIFADQAARLGQPAAIVSAVGDDDFGRMTSRRLLGDGVDISALAIDPERPTGTAFVRYRPDGSRDFVYNIRHSACGAPPLTDATERAIATADHLHVMGSSFFSPGVVGLNLRALEAVKSRGGTVSFDPNLRKEILRQDEIRLAMERVLRACDVFLPSGDELMLLTTAGSRTAAVAEILARGVQVVVHKRGCMGASCYDAAGELEQPAFVAEEIDPTGAGDCFGAAFVVLWLRGTDIDQALALAVAAGAFAVTRRGPMEGVADLETLRRFAATAARRG
jgi:hypothetical protein